MDKVAMLLNKYGPMLGGELARYFEQEYHVTNDTARKALSRARSPVQKISSFSFDKNQKFFYLEKQFMSDLYTEALIKAICSHSLINYSYVRAFLSQNGYISKSLLPAFVSSPIEKLKGHKMHKRVIEDLLQHRIIEEFDEEHWVISRTFFNNSSFNFARAKGLEIAKKVIINDFYYWARGTNFASFNSGKQLFDAPEFAKFQWAFTAPSYLHPVYDEKKEQPGFIIADVFYGKTASVEDVQFFINKIKILKCLKGLPNFVPVLLVEKLEEEALKLLKANKVVIGILDNFFGDKYSELLADLVNVFSNATAILLQNPNLLTNIFDKISQTEGKYNNVVGDFFELLVGYFYQSIGCRYMKAKELITTTENKHREIDVLVFREGKVIVVECKATRAKLNKVFVEKWLHDNIPPIREWLLQRYPDEKNFEFELWSVGGFDDEALVMLQEEKEKTRKYTISFYDSSQIIQLADKMNASKFKAIYKQHFTGTLF